MARYETIYEAAKRWRITPEAQRERCARGDIKDARQHEGIWLIPIE